MTAGLLPAITESEVEFTAMRAQGAGGQNVNKVSSAVHLRFDIRASSLPEAVKQALLHMQDQRISNDGVVVIKAQSFRTRDQNKADALARLADLIAQAAHRPATRRPTKPTLASKRLRLDSKSQRSNIKAGRGKVAL